MHPLMEKAQSEAYRFDPSEGRWRDVRDRFRTSTVAIYEYWSKARSAAHAACDELEARHAVVGAWPSVDWAIADSWTMRTVLDTPKGDLVLGPNQKFQEQISLASSWKLFFGRTYARHPRWGNYLNDVHLEKIGGVERIAAEVEPAAIRRVGELTYVQLTSSVETGMSAEAGVKRDKLEALMAPMLPGAGAGSG